MILVNKADLFHIESLRILAERLSPSEPQLPLGQICYYSPPKEVGVFSTEIKMRKLKKHETFACDDRSGAKTFEPFKPGRARTLKKPAVHLMILSF